VHSQVQDKDTQSSMRLTKPCVKMVTRLILTSITILFIVAVFIMNDWNHNGRIQTHVLGHCFNRSNSSGWWKGITCKNPEPAGVKLSKTRCTLAIGFTKRLGTGNECPFIYKCDEAAVSVQMPMLIKVSMSSGKIPANTFSNETYMYHCLDYSRFR
jgi:hypothetical protein